MAESWGRVHAPFRGRLQATTLVEPAITSRVCGVTRFVVDCETLLRIAAGEIEVAAEHKLVAPTLVRSQALSALYEAARRGEISAAEGIERVTRINSLKVRFLGDKVLQRTGVEGRGPAGVGDDVRRRVRGAHAAAGGRLRHFRRRVWRARSPASSRRRRSTRCAQPERWAEPEEPRLRVEHAAAEDGAWMLRPRASARAWVRDPASRDEVRAERRCDGRVSGHGRGQPGRPRARPGDGVAPGAVLGDPGGGRVDRAPELVRSVDPVRQAGDGHERPSFRARRRSKSEPTTSVP